MEMLMWLDMVVRYGVGNRHPCPDGCRSSLGVLGLVARHDIDKKIKDLGARDSGDDAGLLQRAALVLLCAHPTGSRMNISQARVKTTGGNHADVVIDLHDLLDTGERQVVVLEIGGGLGLAPFIRSMAARPACTTCHRF
jgi:hypothetical protein